MMSRAVGRLAKPQAGGTGAVAGHTHSTDGAR
jgi:hypothetical protein